MGFKTADICLFRGWRQFNVWNDFYLGAKAFQVFFLKFLMSEVSKDKVFCGFVKGNDENGKYFGVVGREVTD